MKHIHTIRLRDVRRMQQRSKALELSHAAVLRLRWIAYYLTHGKSISLTARHFGIARSTFVRWARRYDPSDPYTLEERSRRPRRVRQPETPQHVVDLIGRYRFLEPKVSKERLCERLRYEHGIILSSATVGRIVKRHGFFFAQTPSHERKRRAALEKGLLNRFLPPHGTGSDGAMFPDAPEDSLPFSTQLGT